MCLGTKDFSVKWPKVAQPENLDHNLATWATYKEVLQHKSVRNLLFSPRTNSGITIKPGTNLDTKKLSN